MVILSDPSLNNCLPLSLTYLQSVSQSITVSVSDTQSGVIVTWTIRWCDVFDLLYELVYLRTFCWRVMGSIVWKTIFLILERKSNKKVQILVCVHAEKSGGGLRHQIYRRCTSVWCTCILSSTCILSKCYFCKLSSTCKLSTCHFCILLSTCILSKCYFSTCILSKCYFCILSSTCIFSKC